MKKLILAVALTVSGVAFAGGESKPSDTRSGIDATEVGPGLKNAAKDVGQTVGLETEKEGTWRLSKSYEMKGKVDDPAGGKLTVVREGLPDASLDIRDNTVVMLDGKKVDAKALPVGAEVRANFQLEGQETVALKIEASSPNKKVKGEGEKKFDDTLKK